MALTGSRRCSSASTGSLATHEYAGQCRPAAEDRRRRDRRARDERPPIALCANAPDNEWLGITFRTSRTFVRFVDGHPQLSNGERLTLASDEQRREFFQLRRRENDETDFKYPSISYTISESDLRLPELPPRTLR
jgi:hypothetical protein